MNFFLADVFSVGATLVHMVLGYPLASPPKGYVKKAKEFLYYKEGVKTCMVRFRDLDKAAPLSEDFVDLINKMMSENPLERPSMKDVLSHPWFAQTEEKK